MTRTFSSWVLEAAALRTAFAQVREDPLLDLWVVNQFVSDARVIMIASGGCTAALLASAPKVARLHLGSIPILRSWPCRGSSSGCCRQPIPQHA